MLLLFPQIAGLKVLSSSSWLKVMETCPESSHYGQRGLMSMDSLLSVPCSIRNQAAVINIYRTGLANLSGFSFRLPSPGAVPLSGERICSLRGTEAVGQSWVQCLTSRGPVIYHHRERTELKSDQEKDKNGRRFLLSSWTCSSLSRTVENMKRLKQTLLVALTREK